MSNHQINQSVSIQNSTTFPLTTTTYSPIKQELSNNSNLSFALQQQQLDRNVPNTLLDRRRSSGSIPVFSNNEGQHNLFKGEESPRHQSFGAQPKNISNIRFSQEIPSYTMQNNPIGNTFNVAQQSVMLMPDKEHQKQTKKESAGFGIEEKPIHECDACGKRLCSSRSLKRHKSTCKRVKAVTEQLQGGDFGSPPPTKPENISENKIKDQQNIQKQIRKISGANQISNANKNNEKVNLTQPVVRQSSSESINTQPFVLSQPPPQNCSLASNNSSPIKFCNNSDSQNCGGLSSPSLVIQQQQFYSKQPYSSAQIQVLKQENDSKKNMEIPSKLTPVTAMDGPNKVFNF
uniref:C2H2-type domain-containing protein n=1 Tax=Meloidogyne incognita TaxID=6306 RepID=A0A914NGM5_MELIC